MHKLGKYKVFAGERAKALQHRIGNVRMPHRRRRMARAEDELAVMLSTTRNWDARMPGFQDRLAHLRYSFALDKLVKMMSNNSPSVGIILILLLCTGGCGLPKRQFASLTGLGDKMSLQVTTSSVANQNSPVAMDIVVTDKKLLSVLDGLTASAWFQKRAQIELDHPGKIEVLTDLQLVPGQTYGPVKLKFDPKFTSGILYVNYFTPGAHRAVIDIHKPLVVELQQSDFKIQMGK